MGSSLFNIKRFTENKKRYVENPACVTKRFINAFCVVRCLNFCMNIFVKSSLDALKEIQLLFTLTVLPRDIYMPISIKIDVFNTIPYPDQQKKYCSCDMGFLCYLLLRFQILCFAYFALLSRYAFQLSNRRNHR